MFYIDADTFYAWGMSQPFPYKFIRVRSQSEPLKLKVTSQTSKGAETGFLMEVDMKNANEKK